MYTVNLTKKQLAGWLRALRSGAYRQGRKKLVSIEYDNKSPVGARKVSFCCMGVLGQVCGLSIHKMNNQGVLDVIGRTDLIGEFSSAGDGTVSDETVSDLYLSFDPSDKSTHCTLPRKLAAMNDSGKTFRQIAAWIQRNVKAKHG